MASVVITHCLKFPKEETKLFLEYRWFQSGRIFGIIFSENEFPVKLKFWIKNENKTEFMDYLCLKVLSYFEHFMGVKADSVLFPVIYFAFNILKSAMF